MTQLMQKRRLDFFAKDPFVAPGQVPEIFQEQNYLRRHGHVAFLGKFRPGKQAQCVRFNAIRPQTGVGNALERHRQLPGPLTQWLWQ